MNPLPPIPTPPGERWKEFRFRGIPVLVLAGIVLATSFIWNSNLVPSTVVGEVQGLDANITSTVPGTLGGLSVGLFDRVTNGQPLLKLRTVGPETLDALLADARAELQILRVRMIQDQGRSDHEYIQLRIDLMDQRLLLEGARIRLEQAEKEFRRMSDLVQANVIQPGLSAAGDVGFEVALRDRDLLRREVGEKEKLVAETEQALKPIRPPSIADQNPTVNSVIEAAISAKEEQIRRTMGSDTLHSPLDGIVTAVFRRPGENIVAGEPLLTVSSDRPDRIIGFVRQPLAIVPQVGDRVDVRTRSGQAQRAVASVLKVGPRLELFSQPLRVRGFDSSQERGLPILVNLPPELKVRSGEIVDLILHRTPN